MGEDGLGGIADMQGAKMAVKVRLSTGIIVLQQHRRGRL
jgi:hypothetical protein